MSDSEPWRHRTLTDVTITVQLAGALNPHRQETYFWEAALVRYLLETPGGIEDFCQMPWEERMALVDAEVEHDTPERRALVAHAMQILRGFDAEDDGKAAR